MAEVYIDVIARDSGAGSILGNLGSVITGIESAINLMSRAWDAAVGAITPFINSASESQQAIFQLDAILRATSGAVGMTSQELQNMADNLQNVTRFSDETILSGVSMLLTFRNIGEETFPRATEAMLDMASMFGSVDTAAIQLGKALNDPIAGIGALQRIGIQFTDEQKKMIENFVLTGDVAAAQNIILTEVEMQLGGLSEAMAGTFAGQWDVFLNKLDTFRELIGGPVIQALGDLIGKINDFVDTNPAIQAFKEVFTTFNTLLEQGAPGFSAFALALDNLTLKFPELTTLIQPFTDAFIAMQMVVDEGGTMFDALIAGLEKLAGSDSPLAGLAGKIQEVLTAFDEGGMLAAIDTLVAGIIDGLTGSINAWVAGDGPAQLSAKLISWIDSIGTGEGVATRALVAAGNLVMALADALDDVEWGAIASKVDSKLAEAIDARDFVSSGASFAAALEEALTNNAIQGSTAESFWERLFDNFANAANMLPGINILVKILSSETTQAVWGAVNEFLSGMLSGLENWTTIAEQKIDEWWGGLGDRIANSIKESFNSAFAYSVDDLWSDITDGFEDGWRSFNQVMNNLLSYSISDLVADVKRLLGISSPSTVFFNIGKDIVQGLINGVSSMWNTFVTWITTKLENLLENFSFDNILGTLTGEGGTAGVTANVTGLGTQTTDTGSVLTGGGVVNNFYGAVYFQGLQPIGYDCPSPHPLLAATSGSVGGF
jgi:hypothetical protein